MQSEDKEFKKLVQSIAKNEKGEIEINPRFWNNKDLSSFLEKKGIKLSLQILSKTIENKKLKICVGSLNGNDFLNNGINNFKNIDAKEKKLIEQSK